jgi:hypothetical protein
MLRTLTLLAALGVVMPAPAAGDKAPDEKKLAESFRKATAGGKYRMLLRQIKVANDQDNYGDFNDYGLYSSPEYAGYRDLPRGYWVYAAPYWYIWRDLASERRPNRDWGPEQMIGPPDTMAAGDFGTAWASRTPDESDEWVLVEFASPVAAKEIHVHETFNPGAVIRATAFKLDGTEVEVWKGKDPSAGKDIATSVLPVKGDFLFSRVKLYIDSRNVEGWNEIDAVGLKDKTGKVQWAVAADASTTFAQPRVVSPREERIRELEKELTDLKARIRKLEQQLDKKDDK